MRTRALTIMLMVVAMSMCAAGVFAAPSHTVKSEEVSTRSADTKEVVLDSSKVNEAKAQEVEAERNRLFQESWGMKKEIEGLKQQLATQEEALKNAPLAANKEMQKLTKELESTHAELDQLRGSPGIEMFAALDAKGENVKLRGFGSIRLIPINNDYLVLVTASQAKKAEALFSKTKPVELVGKVNAFFFSDKRYFVSQQVAPAKPVAEENKH